MKLLIIPFLAILMLGCGTNATTNTGFKMADSGSNPPVVVDTTTHRSPNNVTTSTPSKSNPPPNSDTTAANTPNTTTSTSADLPSIISSSTIKFDENFNPVATITLHNTTGKEIDQIMFRFTFTDDKMSDGRLDLVAASDYSTYVNYTLELKPPYSQTIEIPVPQPKMKAFDTPNIFITKVRYYDGTIDTDNR